MAAAFGDRDKAQLSQLLTDCGLSPTVRGETLGIDEFARLSNALGRK